MGVILNEIKEEYPVESWSMGCPPYSFLNADGRRFERAVEAEVLKGGLVKLHLRNWWKIRTGLPARITEPQGDINNASSPDKRWVGIYFTKMDEWDFPKAHEEAWRLNPADRDLYKFAQIVVKGKIILMSQTLLDEPNFHLTINDLAYLTIRRPYGAQGRHHQRSRRKGATYKMWNKPRLQGPWEITLKNPDRAPKGDYLLYKPQVEGWEK